MSSPEPTSENPGAPRVTRENVMAKCDYFTRVQLWPLRSVLDPESWLKNFRPNEQDHAVHLLNSFMYFTPHLVHEMFAASIQALSRFVLQPGDSRITAQSAWSTFLGSAIIVPVAGETDNPSDSGYSFARMARQHLGFTEGQIMPPAKALASLMAAPRPVIFVDDFVGTGEQFVTTWKREVATVSGSRASFLTAARVGSTRFFYCPVLCTTMGFDRIRRECPIVSLNPAHVLTSRYSALSPDSMIWPQDLRATASDFLQTASHRAGIPDDGETTDDWRGYQGQGLVVAIHETIPDATLCLLRWNRNGWKPLMVKA